MAIATAPAAPATAARPRQNWILDPAQDALFIIAAPLLMVAVAVAALRAGVTGDTLFGIFVVFNVAHHLPTFLRIYGDVDLFRRFRWSFVLGPLVPFAFCLGVLGYLKAAGQPIERFFYLFIILTIWDPWHFLMQHYGFMRIYDRPNQAPRALSARMDLALCATWFAAIMLAAANWLPEILYNLYCDSRIPAVFAVAALGLRPLEYAAWGMAGAASVAYAIYLVWCLRRGYFVSMAKLALFAVTFGMMALAYTPNRWIEAAAPDWSFKVGFAALGMVHVSQYLAIVWKYNRGLAGRPGRARPGWFRSAHARGGLIVAAIYVALCLAYGLGLGYPRELARRIDAGGWLMPVLLAAGFTSTLMHYYFDGFIWKIRHQQNREGLALADAGPAAVKEAPAASWWDRAREPGALGTLARHGLYFALPMGLLTLGAWATWRDPAGDPVALKNRVEGLARAGRIDDGLHAARQAIVAIDRQVAVERAILRVRPTANHYAALGYLLYDRASFAQALAEAEGQRPESARLAAYRAQVAEAAEALERAAEAPGAIDCRFRRDLTRPMARATAARWRSVAVGATATAPAVAGPTG